MATVDTTIARTGQLFLGSCRVQLFKYTGPASYATGGELVGSAEVGLEPEYMPDLVAWSGSACRLLVYDYTNKKYVWYVPNTGAEVANGVDLSTFVARGLALGR